jgi:hypothetical protein
LLPLPGPLNEGEIDSIKKLFYNAQSKQNQQRFPLPGGGLGEEKRKMDQSTASKENHFFYNKRLKSFARSNRNSATKAEACLWKYVLRAGMMKGNYIKKIVTPRLPARQS